MANDPRRGELRGDEAELFRSYNDHLLRKVAHAVRAPWEVVEDACAIAWARFLVSQPDRDREWRGWLFRTAEREAWALMRRESRAMHFTREGEDGGPRDVADPRDAVGVRAELREILVAIGTLSDRDRWLVARRAEGYRYEEISELAGGTYTSVNRGLTRATAQMRALLVERDDQHRPRTPRAARLAQLERDPPTWLRARIGKPPRHRQQDGKEAAMVAWRRAALALDDYGRAHDPDFAFEDAGTPPHDDAAVRARAVADSAVRRLNHALAPNRALERDP
jgi:DNA-directed RNA polymerase specialized sigma24 family protein